MKDKLKRLADYIGFDNIPKSWKISYDSASKLFENEIIDKQYLIESIKFYRLNNDINFIKDCMITLQEIKDDENLRQIYWVVYYILYIDKSNLNKDIWNWNCHNDLFKKHGSYMINVILLLSGMNIHNENMKNRNYDDEQKEYHIKNINETCINDKRKLGINGIRFSQLIWGAYFINTKIIQLGRLQYELDTWNKNNTEKYIMEDGELFVKIHIPASGRLNECEVKKSIEIARDSINKYFKEIENKNIKFLCHSWLLSSELKLFLDRNSNIIKFQNLFELLESNEGKKEFYNFVFNMGIKNVNDKELPEHTSLQKKIKKYILDGNDLHEGYGILKTISE